MVRGVLCNRQLGKRNRKGDVMQGWWWYGTNKVLIGYEQSESEILV